MSASGWQMCTLEPRSPDTQTHAHTFFPRNCAQQAPPDHDDDARNGGASDSDGDDGEDGPTIGLKKVQLCVFVQCLGRRSHFAGCVRTLQTCAPCLTRPRPTRVLGRRPCTAA